MTDSDIANSIRLGIHVESDDPNLEDLVKSITIPQIAWISAWLEGEGFGQLAGPSEDLAAARAQAATYRHAIAEALDTLENYGDYAAVGTAPMRLLRAALNEGGEA